MLVEVGQLWSNDDLHDLWLVVSVSEKTCCIVCLGDGYINNSYAKEYLLEGGTYKWKVLE